MATHDLALLEDVPLAVGGHGAGAPCAHVCETGPVLCPVVPGVAAHDDPARWQAAHRLTLSYHADGPQGPDIFPHPSEWDGDSVTELNALILAQLYTDAEAADGVAPPDNEPAGFFGDAIDPVPGFVRGSQLWTLADAPTNESTRSDVERHVADALQPLVDLGILGEVGVTARITEARRIDFDVSIPRPSAGAHGMAGQDLWLDAERVANG